ncbi:MAG: hypothetical protein SFV81_30780, partial [Pirellulaceae bacterium]|nr:hypothetical protein [Pirellulaceae bacterium]
HVVSVSVVQELLWSVTLHATAPQGSLWIEGSLRMAPIERTVVEVRWLSPRSGLQTMAGGKRSATTGMLAEQVFDPEGITESG